MLGALIAPAVGTIPQLRIAAALGSIGMGAIGALTAPKMKGLNDCTDLSCEESWRK